MTDSEVQSMIRALDEGIPRKGAQVEFASFGETAVFANQNGYLRLGIEFMKRAFEETNDGADLDYLLSEESDFCLDHLTVTREEFEFLIT